MSTLRQTREIVALNLMSIPQRWGRSGVVVRHCRTPLSARAGTRGPDRCAMDGFAEGRRELP